MLVCDPGTKQWVRPQKDYGSDIITLNASTASLNASTASLNASAASLTATTNQLTTTTNQLTNVTNGLIATSNDLVANAKKRYVAYTQELNWEAATYGTNYTDKYQTVENNQLTGRGRTWVPTDFACDPKDDNKTTPPVLVALDWKAEAGQTMVYDVGCTTAENSSIGRRWYVAMGPKERNTEYGNVCNSGLDSKLLNPVRDPYTTGFAASSQSSDCIAVNLKTPNFNGNPIKARVMVLRYE